MKIDDDTYITHTICTRPSSLRREKLLYQGVFSLLQNYPVSRCR